MPYTSHSWEPSRSPTTRPAPSAPGRRARSRSSRSWPCTPGRPQTRQRIAGLFWPDSTDAQALTNLRRELHHLRARAGRRALPRGDRRRTCAGATPRPCRVDLRVFERRARRGLRGGRRRRRGRPRATPTRPSPSTGGDLLPGVYDDWLLDARARAASAQCVDLCDLVCATRAARRRPGRGAGGGPPPDPAAAAGGGRLPHPDGAAGRPGRPGRRASAPTTTAPRSWSASWASSRTTRRARRSSACWRSTPRPTRPAAGRPAPAAPVGRGAAGRPVSTSWAGSEAWQTAAAGRPRPGAGPRRRRRRQDPPAWPRSPRLARRSRRRGRRAASASAPSGRLALAPVADWLRSPAVQPRPAALDPVWRAEVDRLVPSGDGPRRARRPGRGRMVDAWQRHRFFEGLARALLGVGRPTLLVLDNVQWCDQETLAFLTFFLGLPPHAPSWWPRRCATTTRTTTPTLADWVVRMRATGLLTELALGPLEVADTARLAEAIRGRPLLDGGRGPAARGHGRLPAVRRRGDAQRRRPGRRRCRPATSTAVLRNRLDQASRGGPGGRRPRRRGRARLHPRPARRGQRPRRRQRGARPSTSCGGAGSCTSSATATTSPTTCSATAAYARVSPPRRWLLHRRLAQGLELLHADDTDPVAAQLAEQYARGGQPERAVAYYRRAADVAAGLFAHAEAIRLHRAALAIVRAQPAGPRPRRARSSPSWRRWRRRSTPGTATPRPQLQQVLERVDRAGRVARPHGTRRVGGLVGLWTSRFVQGRHRRRAPRRRPGPWPSPSPAPSSSGAAHFAFGGSAVSLGRPAEALRHFELAADGLAQRRAR